MVVVTVLVICIVFVNYTLPHCVHKVFVFQFVENTIATQRHEVVFFLFYLERADIWINNHHIWVTAKSG